MNIALAISIVGFGAYFAAYIWAFVLASRVSAGWFIALLFFGWLLYPFFAWKHWALNKRTAIAMYSGLALGIIGLALTGR